MIDKYKNWKINDFVEEMILICEIIEIPGMKTKLAEVKDAVKERFTKEEREEAGLIF